MALVYTLAAADDSILYADGILPAIQPLDAEQALHLLDSLTWFPEGGENRWASIATYVTERTPLSPRQSPGAYKEVLERLLTRLGASWAPVENATGRWANIPSPKTLYQLKYAIKAAMLPDSWFSCMNMGYANIVEPHLWLNLPPDREVMAYSLQLYDYVGRGGDLAGKDVLEVGVGRGGGACFLADRYAPRTYTGVDLCPANVDICRNRANEENLTFLQGDAEALPFSDNSFDVVLNIESAHCYPSVERFFAEVRRVLRPGGVFLFSDEWWRVSLDELKVKLESSDLELISEEDITDNIIVALEGLKQKYPAHLKHIESEERRELWRAFFEERVCRDSALSYTSGRFGFFNFVLRKPV
jgi:ubiquinone/menaquinone biosynthesis C-methylase UbiE